GLAARRDNLLDGHGQQSEASRGRAGDRHGHPVGHGDAGRVAHVTRLVVDHFVARVHHRPQRDVQRLADADGDQNLMAGIVADAELFFDVIADRLAEFPQAEVGGVTGFAPFQRVYRRLANVPRGDKVRFAYPQRDHVRHRLHDVEKLTDARGWNITHLAGDEPLRL